MRRIKRIAAVCIAVCMILGLSVTAFATEGDSIQTGNLTVTGEQLAGKTVTAVRMFKAAVKEGSAQNEYIFESYELEGAWSGFFADKTTEGTDAGQYVQDLSDGELVNFASEALAWYGTNSSSNDGLKSLAKTVTATQDGDTTKGTAVFNDLDVGYYLVFAGSGPAMLVNIPRDDECTIKSEFPTVDKKVDTDGDGTFADNGSAQIGDTVTFSLTSAVPDMTGYATYQFNFVDTLSNGLTFVPSFVAVKIGGYTLPSGSYTIETSAGEGSNILKVNIANLIDVVEQLNGQNPQVPVEPGTPIVVTYQAVINENALMANPATNEAKVEYSNDPSADTTGTSNPDTSKVYTYAINVHKWSVGNGENNYLAGAKFVLSTSETTPSGPDYGNDDGIIKLVELTGGTTTSYRVAKPDEEGATAEFTTEANSLIHIDGLEAGTYYLHEIKAPEDYNQLKAPIKIEISVENNDYDNPIYKINDTQNSEKDITVKVENKKGLEFPETGGIGTIGLTVLGVGVILLGVLAPRKKKKDQTPQE